jgi:hypothetical protein
MKSARGSERRRRSWTGFLSSRMLIVIAAVVHITNGIRSSQVCDESKLRCQRSPLPYVGGGQKRSHSGTNMAPAASAAAVVDDNKEIFTFFPHRLEIKSKMFMTIFCENLITSRDRDMAMIKICGHARDSVCGDKEQGIPYHLTRSFLNRSCSNSHPSHPSSQSEPIRQISTNLMSSNHTTTADDLNSEKVNNYLRKRRQPQQRLIKSTKFQHTLEAYFTLRKDVPLNQQRLYFLDTILLPISVLYCILEHHHRRLATISNMT